MPQYPAPSIIAGIYRIAVTIEAPSNANLLPLTGWKLQVEEALRKKGLTVVANNGSVNARINVWLSVLRACTVTQGRDVVEVYTYVCKVTVYSNYGDRANDLFVAYEVTAHSNTTRDSLLGDLEKSILNVTGTVGDVLKK